MSMLAPEDSVSATGPYQAQDRNDSEQLAWMVMEHRNLSIWLGGGGSEITTGCSAAPEPDGTATRALQC